MPQLEASLSAWQQQQEAQQAQAQAQDAAAAGASSALPAPQALCNLCWGLQRTGHAPSARLVSLVVQCRWVRCPWWCSVGGW